MSVQHPFYSSSQYPLGHNITTTNGSMDAIAPSSRYQQQADSHYAGVRHKRVEGSLTLTLNELLFRSVGVGAGAGAGAGAGGQVGSEQQTTRIPWMNVLKHQVSPATYPKALLKLVLGNTNENGGSGSGGGSNVTFQLANRNELERIRKDVTARLRQSRSGSSSNGNLGNGAMTSPAAAAAAAASNNSNNSSSSGRKRRLSEMQIRNVASTSFGNMDPTAVAVTRSSLLAANPALRRQHQFLVPDTVTEEDFWNTHKHLVEEEYARISGLARAGASSLLQSHLATAGRVTLGVDEMRQIFILYPAVHKAYEEKVPLELSDEQFWRKYLESEYFHRDRGRMGVAARNHAPGAGNHEDREREGQKEQKKKADEKKKAAGPTIEEQDARAAAIGADDLFSRYDQKMKQAQRAAERRHRDDEDAAAATASHSREVAAAAAAAAASGDEASAVTAAASRRLAVGQFDLASTFETERGHLLEGPRDNHPPNRAEDDAKGARVIRKYNRHWAMVLHPDEAVAGANLLRVARRSARDALPNDDDAKCLGGLDAEMYRLVSYADAAGEEANHATGMAGLDPAGRRKRRDGDPGGDGDDDDDDDDDDQEYYYEPLTLKNVEAYYQAGQKSSSNCGNSNGKNNEEAMTKMHTDFAKVIAAETQALAQAALKEPRNRTLLDASRCLPPAKLGIDLLTALTRKMEADSKTEKASLEMIHRLPEDFRNRLQNYFRRSSELLRHFFGLRRLEAESKESDAAGGVGGNPPGNPGHQQQQQQQTKQKLARIVVGMETFYREMETMRRELPQTKQGQIMSKMCLPIMDQLDWAFKLNREGSTDGRGSGGFVDV